MRTAHTSDAVHDQLLRAGWLRIWIRRLRPEIMPARRTWGPTHYNGNLASASRSRAVLAAAGSSRSSPASRSRRLLRGSSRTWSAPPRRRIRPSCRSVRGRRRRSLACFEHDGDRTLLREVTRRASDSTAPRAGRGRIREGRAGWAGISVAGRRSGTVPWRGDGVGQDPPVVGSGPASGWLGEQVHSGMRFEFPIRYPPRPLLGTMGNPLFDTGGLGSGHAMKALNNFVAAATFAACAEALLAGQRFGLDPTRMVEILNVSTGR